MIDDIENTPKAKKVNKNIANLNGVLALDFTILITEYKTRALTPTRMTAKACRIIARWEKLLKNFALITIIIIDGVIKPRLEIIPLKFPAFL